MSDTEAGDQPAVVESEDIPYAVGFIKKKFDRKNLSYRGRV